MLISISINSKNTIKLKKYEIKTIDEKNENGQVSDVCTCPSYIMWGYECGIR